MADTESSLEIESSPARSKNTKRLVGCFVVTAVGVVVLMLLPMYGWLTERAAMGHEFATVKMLVLDCRLYAEDWDGQFPEKLRDLYPEYRDEERYFRTTVFKKQEFKDYLYFAGWTVKKDGDNMLLIASPFVRKGTRVAGFTGGQVKVLKEDEYQLLLKSARMGYD